MIQNVIGELTSERESVTTLGAAEEEEEEGSSFTPGQEDMEDLGATREVQIADILLKRVEIFLLNLETKTQ